MAKKTPLQKIRKETDLKVAEIAKSLGINRVHYWRIENAEGNPSYPLALKIIEFWRLRGFPVSAEEILDPQQKKAKVARKLVA